MNDDLYNSISNMQNLSELNNLVSSDVIINQFYNNLRHDIRENIVKKSSKSLTFYVSGNFSLDRFINEETIDGFKFSFNTLKKELPMELQEKLNNEDILIFNRAKTYSRCHLLYNIDYDTYKLIEECDISGIKTNDIELVNLMKKVKDAQNGVVDEIYIPEVSNVKQRILDMYSKVYDESNYKISNSDLISQEDLEKMGIRNIPEDINIYDAGTEFGMTIKLMGFGNRTGSNFKDLWESEGSKDYLYEAKSYIRNDYINHFASQSDSNFKWEKSWVVGFEKLNNLQGIASCDADTYTDSDGKFVSRRRPQNTNYYFRKSITWSLTNSTGFGVRTKNPGYIFDINGMSLFVKNEKYYNYIMAFLNTKIADLLMKSINPTMANQSGDILQLPLIICDSKIDEINSLVSECIRIAKDNWDKKETSWNFEENHLIESNVLIRNKVEEFISYEDRQAKQLKELEEKINKNFIDIYDLNEELTEEIDEKNITYFKTDSVQLIKELISYFVGVSFGRYSLNEKGINKDYVNNSYCDQDNIIPISDSNDLYYDDDLTFRICQMIKTVFGENYYNDNIEYISQKLGRKNTESPEQTIRRYLLNEFYLDHVKMYQKKPIYWLIDSGKNNGFKALIYIHRYNNQLMSKIRVDYLHKTQDAYEKIKLEISNKINSVGNTKSIQNDLNNIILKIDECNKFDEKLGHIANQMINIDLNDGIKANYEKFADILAKIK